jgi:HEAT repeat protein
MANWKDFMQVEVESNAQGLHEALGEAAVPALIELIGDPDEKLRNYAANTLAKIGKPSVKPLTAALRDSRNVVREKAALALGMIGADANAATPELVAMLESEKPTQGGHCRGCAAVAFALNHIGTNSVPPLLALLNSDNATASLYAAAALGEIRPKGQDELSRLISALKDSRKHVRASSALVLGELGPAAQPAVPALEAAVMGNESLDIIVAASALEKIEPGGDRGTIALARLLNHEKQDIRLGAASALESLGSKATNACASLLQALSDPDDRVRLGAIRALGAIGLASKEVVDGLIDALKGQPRNRNAAALALSRLGKPAIPTLLRSLKDQDPDVRRWAVFALAQVRDGKEAVPGLVAALDDEMGFVRVEAAQAIGRIGQTWPNANGERQKSPAADAVPGLVRSLKSDDPNLRSAAADAIGNIGQSGDAIAAALTALLSDESVEVRRAAVFSLESLGRFPKEAVPILENAAKDPKAEQSIRSRAARILEKMKSAGPE